MLADSMKWYLEDVGLDGEHEVIGFMNPGGIRAELWHEQSAAGEGDGVVTYAEANGMVPFGNTLNSGDVSGAQFKQMLEEQWQRTADGGDVDSGDEAFLAFNVSENVEYVFDSTRELDDRIVDIRINGESIDPDATYTIVTASFLFEGGDNMWALSEAQNVRDSGVLDRDAFISYLEANPELAPASRSVSSSCRSSKAASTTPQPAWTATRCSASATSSPRASAHPRSRPSSWTPVSTAPSRLPTPPTRKRAVWSPTSRSPTGWRVPEGAVVPLTITAIPEVGTEIVIDIPAFEWTVGGAPAECGDDDDATTPPPGDGDNDDATTPPAGDGDDQGSDDQGDADQGGADQGDDSSRDDDPAAVLPVGDDTSAGGSRSDLARTGVSAGSMIAAAGLLSLAGAGALGLRHRMTRH
ncbi:5'-nucleotidase C-terminal domain-containing protein [Brachybacterium sp. Z12]|uniref:5'-nucleotidase C-terminal domain-containing protein n=1 Tax=Brachybacterium sp. Z12 TaxID=2759167 RepID=UPI00292A5710|nr:5'-nucleotidase C-terminal domain-containing protein [Brachybacterium sp. Z12]